MRRLRHKLNPPPEVCWVCRRRVGGIAKEICVIETAFANEALWVNGKPSALAEIEDVVVMNVVPTDYAVRT
jgi:hypothetical protein